MSIGEPHSGASALRQISGCQCRVETVMDEVEQKRLGTTGWNRRSRRRDCDRLRAVGTDDARAVMVARHIEDCGLIDDREDVELAELAALLRERNAVDARLGRLLDRP
jgi:hypothetical protein